MALTARSMKPARVENVAMPSVGIAQPKERQIFRHDVDVMVFLTEMKGRANCGHGKGTEFWSGQQMCGDTGKCYVCSGVANGKKLADCMNEQVRAGADGLNQVVRTLWAQGEQDRKSTVVKMYEYLYEHAKQRKALSRYGAVRRTRQRAMQEMPVGRARTTGGSC